MKVRIGMFCLAIMLVMGVSASPACAQGYDFPTNTITVTNYTLFTISVTANCTQYPIFGWGGETGRVVNSIIKSIPKNNSAQFKCAKNPSEKIGIENVSVATADERKCSITTPFNENKTWYVKLLLNSRFRLDCTDNP